MFNKLTAHRKKINPDQEWNQPKNENGSSNGWIILIIILFLIVSWSFFDQDQQKQHDLVTTENNINNKEEQKYQTFQQKGYFAKDIKTLKDAWGLEVHEVPDLKAKNRRGVVNILAVDGKTEKGSCSELVVILKESPHVSTNDLSAMKINQGQEFADTRNHNDAVIRFAIAKIIEKGNKWNYDVYVLKANSSAGTISGSSAGSGVYMALFSAFHSDYTIPKNLAITGTLETEVKTKPILKLPQRQTNFCVKCGKYSYFFLFAYTNPNFPKSQWFFCNEKCCNKWLNEDVYRCLECYQQRFGNCSCCDEYNSWTRESNKKEKFCSRKCLNKHWEGRIGTIAGLNGKIGAAVEKGCDIIIIPKSNSSDYYQEVPLSVRMKVKNLYEVEKCKEFKEILLFLKLTPTN